MISHDHKLIFIHIPKCAGRSVCDVFNQRFDHFTASHYQKEYPQQWRDYRKFTIVRNPFARLVSIYTYLASHRRHNNEPVMARFNVFFGKRLPEFSEWVKVNIEAYNAWEGKQEQFLKSPEGMRGADGQLGSPFWFNSQWSRLYTPDGMPPCDMDYQDMIKMDGPQGMAQVGWLLSEVMNEKISLPHTNKSNDQDFHSFYTPETIELVSQFAPVKEDCKIFNYKFSPE